jgi:hypothetical protein
MPTQSKRSQEGYFLLDHRESPGLTDAHVQKAALPPGAGRGIFEAPQITCSHCQKGVVINPLRNRDRNYCAKCDHYICDDPCGLAYKVSGGACKTYKQLVAELYEQGLKETQRNV